MVSENKVFFMMGFGLACYILEAVLHNLFTWVYFVPCIWFQWETIAKVQTSFEGLRWGRIIKSLT